MAFKDLLFKSTNGPTVVETPTAKPLFGRRTPSATTYMTDTATMGVAVEPVTSQEVQNFMAEISTELEKCTSSGFHEFTAQMDVLEKAIPDERVRAQIAATSVTSLKNLTLAQIAASVQERIDRLNKHRGTITASLNAEVSDKTALNSNHLKDLADRLMKNRAEQDRLRQEATAMETDSVATQRQLQEIEAQSRAVEAQYETAYKTYLTALTETLNQLPRQ